MRLSARLAGGARRLLRRLAAASLLLCLAGFSLRAASGDRGPLLFSAVLQRLSAQPGFRDKVLDGIRDLRFGEFLSPDLLERLRVLILGKDWQRVDHFPALTVAALNASVGTVSGLAGTDRKPLDPAALLDLGPYPLNRSETIALDRPAAHPDYTEDPATARRALGFELVMGDGPDPDLAPMHAASYQLAAVLNRLAMNPPGQHRPGQHHPGQPEAVATLAGRPIIDGASLIAALAASGHRVTLTDDVYFANFGHLHSQGREVMMPFWVDTQIAVPATRRSLLLPVSHSEEELHVRGPVWNADVSFYYGIDGKAEFRTMDERNQSWVMHRALHTYSGEAQQRQALALLASALRVYYAVRSEHPELPFGGYYRLGVCQDVGAVIETVLDGETVLFPITHDPAYFEGASSDPRDALFLRTFAALPSDRGTGMPPVHRVLGAVPTTHYHAILIPGLGADLERVEVARRLGLTERTHPLLIVLAWGAALLLLGGFVAWWIRRRMRRRSNRRGSL